MKLTTTRAILPLLATVVASLAGCGGGGDAEAGAPVALNVNPSTWTTTALEASAGGPPTGQCGGGFATQVFIYGGAGPYRIDNPSPDRVSIDRTKVDGPGGSFNVTYIGSCFTVTVMVIDKLNNQVTLTLKNEPAGGTTTTP